MLPVSYPLYLSAVVLMFRLATCYFPLDLENVQILSGVLRQTSGTIIGLPRLDWIAEIYRRGR